MDTTSRLENIIFNHVGVEHSKGVKKTLKVEHTNYQWVASIVIEKDPSTIVASSLCPRGDGQQSIQEALVALADNVEKGIHQNPHVTP